ncbi:heme-binding domain-containing protein [Lutibacter sp.]|uniref:heme-binding domain-containing protein n=1 Tax=Lutibacter sp. TaxID=1925666 RepID=UPI001A286ECA|nr:heme-binding domain-containing protein [Lutibacter sp.]MBI9042472.1 heme-binding domain-containing protein [Lutibacter sp.]
MKKILLALLAVIILIQFIRPEKNNSNNELNAISTVMDVPAEVQEILKTSCNDCHSNNTVYPWYSEIAPVSWYLASHVNEGKEHLNFSEWASYNENQKSHIIKDIEEELQDKEMPLKSYLIIHENAKMTEAQYKIMLNWVKTLK